MFFSRSNTFNRTNTFLQKEFFKAVLFGISKEKAEAASTWLSGSQTASRGIYGCPFFGSQMIIFPRWVDKNEKDHKQPTAAAVEACLIFADSKEEISEIHTEMKKYGNIPIVVVISQNDLEEEALSIKAKFFKQHEDNQEPFKYMLDDMDKIELQQIKSKFTEFDLDGSGAINTEEMKQIAVSMGEDVNSAEFKESMLALDFTDDGEIQFTEFCSWWKIGRQNVTTLPKIFHLSNNTRDFINDTIDNNRYYDIVGELQDKKGGKDAGKSYPKVYIRSLGQYNIQTSFTISLAVSGPMRQKMAMDFLSEFTTNQSISKSNWISVLIPVDERKKMSSAKARGLLEEFKDNVMKWGETQHNPALVAFVKNLIVFEFNSNDKSAIMVARLKLDIEEVVKLAIQQVIHIISNLSAKNDSFWFNLKSHSNFDVLEGFLKGEKMTIGNWLKISELYFEGSGNKKRFKAFYDCLDKKHQHWLTVVKTMFLSKNYEMDFDGDITELMHGKNQELLDIDIGFFGEFMSFMKNNISNDLLKVCKKIRIGINMFNVFAGFSFKSKTMLGQKK